MKGVLRFDPTLRTGQAGWTRFTVADGVASDSTSGLFESRDGTIWIGHMWGGGISRFDGEAWQTYPVPDGLPERVHIDTFWQAGDGTLWCVGSNGQLGRFDGNRWTTYPTGASPLTGRVLAQPTRDGAIWFWPTHASRVLRFDPVGTGAVAAPDSLLGGFPMPNGSVWFRTRRGPVQYDGVHWLRYTPADGLLDARYYRSQQTEYGSLWFFAGEAGMTRGLTRYQNGFWSNYTADQIGLDDVRTVLQAKDGSLWFVGSREGASAAARYDGQAWKVYTPADGVVGTSLRQVCQARNGDLWFRTAYASSSDPSSGHGVLRFDGAKWTSYTAENGLCDNRVYYLFYAPDGRLYVGTYEGLSWFDGTSWESYTYEDGLRRNKPSGFLVHNNDLWFHYPALGHGGATCYDGKQWRHHTTNDGLLNDNVRSIYPAQDGALWFSTPEGVSRFDPSAGSGQAAWISYTEADGLPGNDIRGTWQTADGVFWFLTPSGKLGRFVQDEVGPETTVEAAPEEVSPAGNLMLGWSGRDMWDDTVAEDLLYQWRLDGGEWSHPRDRTDFTFTSLPSGGHTFEVRARDHDLNSDPTPASHAFVVLPPWWRNPWMLGLAAVLVGLVAVQTGRVVRRDRKLRGANAELQQKTEAAERRAAVDRVRAEAAAMQKSDEIDRVVVALWTALEEIGLVFDNFGIQVINSEAEVLSLYTPQRAGMLPADKVARESVLEGIHLYSVDIPLGFARERGYAMPGVKPGIHAMEEGFPEEVRQLWFADTPPDDVPDLSVLIGLDMLNVPFADGGIVVFAPEGHRYTPHDLQIAVEFADGVSLGFTRFLDFQRLELQNRAMSDANKELFRVNQTLQRDRAVERIRAEVQAMDEASDFERVLSMMSEDLKTVGLTFETCAIDVLDEPVDEPTIDIFRDQGFRYTAYKLDPDGSLDQESYHLSAPFPDVNLQMIERFVEGEPWQGRSGENAIVEVPAASYGRLRLTASDRPEFSEDDIAALRDFASAIALGYARYLDIREIQEQTQRKSAFLASMSHDLRTPMNAIKGFTSMVLRRIGDTIPERHRDNLSKVIQAADVLLEMINDLMDLSKIEAGGMDVNPEPFDVKALVATCCATVSPLVSEEAGVELNYEVSGDVGDANTDQARLRRMVINLLSNAVKFTDAGAVTAKAAREGDQLVISVTDTGKGIPADEIDTIFDEYRQVKGSDREGKGTGLGLSITKKFAELLGGSVSVESNVGVGSTFTVRVPVEYAEKRTRET